MQLVIVLGDRNGLLARVMGVSKKGVTVDVWNGPLDADDLRGKQLGVVSVARTTAGYHMSAYRGSKQRFASTQPIAFAAVQQLLSVEQLDQIMNDAVG